MFNFFKKPQMFVTEPQAFIFIGRSGSGKGTQAELFKKTIEEKTRAKTLHVETGAFFREFIKKSLYTELLARKVIESGGLMPEAMAIHMWVSYLVDNFTGKENLIFDGAPRKLLEAELLDGVLKFYNIKNYKVIYINVSHDWSKERLMARGRKDDTNEGIEKRLEWFDKDVMPSINFFKANADCTFVDINGEQTIEEVHKEIINKVFGNN
jgi:adenylate kinase family enzyme